MATRSTIGIINKDGSIKSIYCHWDGYVSYVGRILVQNFTRDKADQLIELGNISSLGSEIGEEHNFDDPPDDTCNFYGRDRKEPGNESNEHYNLNQFFRNRKCSGAEYCYVMDLDDKWYLCYLQNNKPKLKLVQDILDGKED